MIDDSRVEHMAREYAMNPDLARKLLEDAGVQPAAVIRRHRRYEQLVGGDTGGDKDYKKASGFLSEDET